MLHRPIETAPLIGMYGSAAKPRSTVLARLIYFVDTFGAKIACADSN